MLSLERPPNCGCLFSGASAFPDPQSDVGRALLGYGWDRPRFGLKGGSRHLGTCAKELGFCG